MKYTMVILAALLTMILPVMAIGPIYSNQTTAATTVPSHMNTTSTAYTVKLMYNSTLGYYLTNSSGYALYMYTKDIPHSGNSSCYGSCAKFWPAFYTANLTLPSGLSASNFSTITRTNGTKQLAYDGYPLYLYVYDTGPGQVTGQGAEGTWFVMSPTGPVMSGQAATTALSTMPYTNATTMPTTAPAANTSTSGYTAPASSSGSSTIWIIIGIVVVLIIIAAAAMMMRKK